VLNCHLRTLLKKGYKKKHLHVQSKKEEHVEDAVEYCFNHYAKADWGETA
jgi:hypothetical protein